jgi:YHS domain-containing protein
MFVHRAGEASKLDPQRPAPRIQQFHAVVGRADAAAYARPISWKEDVMKLRPVPFLLLGFVLVAAGSLASDKKAPKEWKALCPVSGKAAVKSVSADYRGGKVYFCCPGCIAPFKKNTAKYAAKANEQLVVTGQAKQVACPITGRPVNPAKSLEVGGVKVCFCCGGCQGKVKKADAAEQIDLVFGKKGFAKGFKVETESSK